MERAAAAGLAEHGVSAPGTDDRQADTRDAADRRTGEQTDRGTEGQGNRWHLLIATGVDHIRKTLGGAKAASEDALGVYPKIVEEPRKCEDWTSVHRPAAGDIYPTTAQTAQTGDQTAATARTRAPSTDFFALQMNTSDLHEGLTPRRGEQQWTKRANRSRASLGDEQFISAVIDHQPYLQSRARLVMGYRMHPTS
ncbi:predicted protein [Postia placenta Mad-698-R]|uniref:Uncharacterized protein n=1 Tax=Postia placenta MAD-698-R-SB12 TaxID=670580 RepID=A0A1X6NHU8_9APHY|nr:hypothetical protein POSPLADRAFT_1030979 [Postia placenta MAD-698-R-SB12]EED85780.1 predicted protein [Postia placenta Mad-698-R]OSX68184.1 hypothetical protein POSPLADRAFT_1030979 [Postia placenta MAD-698-R-SB12]